MCQKTNQTSSIMYIEGYICPAVDSTGRSSTRSRHSSRSSRSASSSSRSTSTSKSTSKSSSSSDSNSNIGMLGMSLYYAHKVDYW